MLTAELKINGVLIGHFYIVNRGQARPGSGSEETKYSVECYDVGAGTITKTEVNHLPSDGAISLLGKAAKKVRDKKLKDAGEVI